MKNYFLVVDDEGNASPSDSFDNSDSAEHFVQPGFRVVEYVPLTPRVRLGLWLAEDETRRWFPGKVGTDWVAELVAPSIYSRGTGPTLDAAIEDALAKLPTKESP